MIFERRWRIVRDRYSGYEVQSRAWWSPFWRQHKVNTHNTVSAALAYAKREAEYVVQELGPTSSLLGLK